MDYQAYRLKFKSPIHFGIRSLEDGSSTFCADTLFSALCQEALKMGESTLQEFCGYAREGILLLSDAFPYAGSTYYLPKPAMRIEAGDTKGKGDSVIKKAYKKLKYIPMEDMDSYLAGTYDVLHAADISGLGEFEMKVSASIRGEEETVPYRIRNYYFYPGNGLYFIIGYETPQILHLAEELLQGLSYCGIGGRKASGNGRFTFSSENLPDAFLKRLKSNGSRYMSLSVSLPRDSELEEALQGAEYLMCKRSGFVDSDSYAPQQMRKKDLYAFQAGSCFSVRYEGDVYDVSAKGGSHPVYRYAKPVFMEVYA